MQNNMKSVCYLDLDGCVTDFVGGALKAHNVHIPPDEIGWDFAEQIGMDPYGDFFWAPFDHDFWANLDWTSEGKELLRGIEFIFGDNVALMTSPCTTHGSVEGKITWIKRELPKYSRKFFVGPPKHLVASPTKILVDDHDGNVDKFAEHGGKTVLVPRPWNRRKSESTGGKFDVQKLLSEIEVIARV